jgi:hypothetical protein
VWFEVATEAHARWRFLQTAGSPRRWSLRRTWEPSRSSCTGSTHPRHAKTLLSWCVSSPSTLAPLPCPLTMSSVGRTHPQDTQELAELVCVRLRQRLALPTRLFYLRFPVMSHPTLSVSVSRSSPPLPSPLAILSLQHPPCFYGLPWLARVKSDHASGSDHSPQAGVNSLQLALAAGHVNHWTGAI